MEKTPGTPPETAESKQKEELHTAVDDGAIWIYARIIAALNSKISPTAVRIMAECLAENKPSSTGDVTEDMEELLLCAGILSAGDLCSDTVDEKDQIGIATLAAEYMRDAKNTMEAFRDCLYRARLVFLPVPIF